MRAGDHKRRILAAEQAWARSEGLMRALVERGVYVVGGLTHQPHDGADAPSRPPVADFHRRRG